MALFPRKIKRRYVMLNRQDYENICVMFSDHLHFWYSAHRVLQPKFSGYLFNWETAARPRRAG